MELVVDARVFGSRPCGIGMYAFRFVKELMKNPDIRITLLTDVASSREITALRDAGIPVAVYGKSVFRSAAVFRYFRFVAGELRARQPDVFWEPNCQLPVRLRGYRGKLAVTVYDMFPLTMPDCFGGLYRRYFRFGVGRTIGRADLLCFDSQEAKESTEAFFPKAKKKKSFVCYPIVERNDPDAFLNEEPERNRKEKKFSAKQGKKPEPPKAERYLKRVPDRYFYCIGNVEKRKGTDVLLRAYELYRAEGGQKGLILAGGLKDESMLEFLERAKKTEGFVYTGYVSEEDKQILFDRCDTFVFPSRGEGFGIPVLEAMAAGKPVIASRLSVFEEVIGDCIQYFDMEGSAEEQAQALCRAMRHDLDADREAYERVLGRYGGEKLGEQFAGQMFALCRE